MVFSLKPFGQDCKVCTKNEFKIFSDLQFLSSLVKMDHRIEIFMLKLVCAENFKLFRLSGCELTHFKI